MFAKMSVDARQAKRNARDAKSFDDMLERFLILKNDPTSLQWYRDWLELPTTENLSDFLRDVHLEHDEDYNVDYEYSHINEIETRDATTTIYTRVNGYSNELWNHYIDQLLSKLFVLGATDRGSVRLAITKVLEGMPSVRWEVNNVLSREFLEEVVKGNLSLGKVETYTGAEYFDINKFFRDLASSGRAKINWPTFRHSQYAKEYRGDDLHILSRSTVTPHPFQVLQWLMALSPPLSSDVRVYR